MSTIRSQHCCRQITVVAHSSFQMFRQTVLFYFCPVVNAEFLETEYFLWFLLSYDALSTSVLYAVCVIHVYIVFVISFCLCLLVCVCFYPMVHFEAWLFLLQLQFRIRKEQLCLNPRALFKNPIVSSPSSITSSKSASTLQTAHTLRVQHEFTADETLEKHSTNFWDQEMQTHRQKSTSFLSTQSYTY